MGRTGRRPGTVRNCLFLATRDETLVQAAGLIDLWHEGYVEPIQPPPEPYHVLAQQLMALVLQERGSAGTPGWSGSRACRRSRTCQRSTSRKSSHGCSPRGCSGRSRASWGSGRRARRPTAAALPGVALRVPLPAAVRRPARSPGTGVRGRTDVPGQAGRPPRAALGGRAWHVTHIDWQRKVAHVEVSEAQGRTRWKGTGQGLSFRLSQAIKRVLAEDEDPALVVAAGPDTDRRGARPSSPG